VTKECAEIDDELLKVVKDSTARIKKIQGAITDKKATAESAEKEAKTSIVTLPGGEAD